MAEQEDIQASDPSPPEAADAADGADAKDSQRSGFSHLWQAPALLLGVGLFLVSVFLAMPRQGEPPPLTPVLDAAHAYLLASNPAEAEKLLREIEPAVPAAAIPERARYEELWGDLVFQQSRVRGVEDPVNDQMVVTYYRRAQELGRELDDQHLKRLAEAYIVLQREDDALRVVEKLKAAAPDRRYGIIRRIIERHAAAPKPDLNTLHKLLTRYREEMTGETDAARRREGEIWELATRCRIQLDGGDHAGVIDLLVRRLITLMAQGGDGKDLAPLMLLRAQAYLQAGDFTRAKEAFLQADQKLAAGAPSRAELLVGLGQIALSLHDDPREALAAFRQAEENHRPQQGDPARMPYMDALIGRIDCEARLGKHDEALVHLNMAVKTLLDSNHPPAERRDRLVQVVLAHHVNTSDLEQYETALEYISALAKLHRQEVPPAWRGMQAVAHERLAAKLLRDAGLPLPAAPAEGGGPVASDPPANVAGPSPQAVRLVRKEAAHHFEQAGLMYEHHARLVAATEPKAAADSWWNAAAAYDNAFQWKTAVGTYQKFIDIARDDVRRPDAMFKLGLAYLADKQYQLAVERFRDLTDSYPTHRAASAALVPMAKAMIAQEKLADATRVLLAVVTDHPVITPESNEYRDALITLGRLYHQARDFENAIQRLAMAVDKYGDTLEGATLRFLLAESYRQSIPQIDKTLADPLPQVRVREFKAERSRRLEQALILHSQVVTQLGEVEEKKLLPLQLLYFRNAYFYRADCAFDLGRHEQAIELYDAAVRRWRNHPASLVALVQMVNAYCELGQLQNARVINLRARDHLKRIPDEAFNDPSLPMTRKHWEDWLQWNSKLNLFDEKAAADAAAAPKP